MFRLWYVELVQNSERDADSAWWKCLNVVVSSLMSTRFAFHLLNRYVLCEYFACDPFTLGLKALNLHPFFELSIFMVLVFSTVVIAIVHLTDHNRLLTWKLLHELVVRYWQVFANIEDKVTKRFKGCAGKYKVKPVPGILTWIAPRVFDHEKMMAAAACFRIKYFPKLQIKHKYEILWRVSCLEMITSAYTAGMIIVSFTIMTEFIHWQVTQLFNHARFGYLVLIMMMDGIGFIGMGYLCVRIGVYMLCTGQVLSLTCRLNIDFSRCLLQSLLSARKKHTKVLTPCMKLLYREHTRIVYFILQSNNELFTRLGTVLVLMALPVNSIFAVMSLTIQQESGTQLLVTALWLVQLVEIFLIILGGARLSCELHSCGGKLASLQTRLVGFGRMRHKLIVHRLIEIMLTRKPVSISMGPLEGMTKKKLLDMSFLYGAYLIYVTRFIREHSFIH